jgi:SNF2 family DNA or RNA helicase
LWLALQDAQFVENFWAREKAREKKMSPASPQALTELLGSGKGIPDFLNGRELRDYQVESFKWMVQHALTNSSCILGDEMGLGKTAQVCPTPLAYPQKIQCNAWITGFKCRNSAHPRCIR